MQLKDFRGSTVNSAFIFYKLKMFTQTKQKISGALFNPPFTFPPLPLIRTLLESTKYYSVFKCECLANKKLGE